MGPNIPSSPNTIILIAFVGFVEQKNLELGPLDRVFFVPPSPTTSK